MSFNVRSATVEDLLQVQSIFEYYVLNTVVSFLVQKPPSDYVKSRFQDSTSRHLPYLVAVDEGSGKIVGYTYASAFRGFASLSLPHQTCPGKTVVALSRMERVIPVTSFPFTYLPP